MEKVSGTSRLCRAAPLNAGSAFEAMAEPDQLVAAGAFGRRFGGVAFGYVLGRAASNCNSCLCRNAKKYINASWLISAMNHMP
jgi:hypothetical protein